MRIEYAILFFCILNTIISAFVYSVQRDHIEHSFNMWAHLTEMEKLDIAVEEGTSKTIRAVRNVLEELLTEVRRGKRNGVE